MVMKYLLPGRAAKKVAAAHGLELETGSESPVGGFVLYGSGHSQKTKRRMWRTGGTARVFDYQYDVMVNGAEDIETDTKKFTGALVDLPFSAPHTVLERETVTSKLVAWAGGPGDIEIDVPEFDSRFKVRSVDEGFVRTLLSPEVIGWMMHGDTVGSSMKYELRGSRLLCLSKRRTVDDFPALLDWATDFVKLAPPGLAQPETPS